MNAEDAEEYTQALGQVLAGGWRQRALAWRLGVPQALGMSLEEWTEQRLGGYVRESIPERRKGVVELSAEGHEPEEIAAIMGTSRATVYRDLDAVSPETEDHNSDRHDLPNDSVPETHPVSPETEDQEIGMPLGQQYADAILADIDEQVADRTVPKAAPAPRIEINDGDEWYTPRWLFDALAIRFSIDACAPLDQTYSSVPAERVFTIEDDGLAQPWEGTVWCNPPYSKPEPWARRMIHHGNGLLLTHMPMNAGWCVDVWEVCDAIRLFQAMEFVRPDGNSQRPGYWLQLAMAEPVEMAAPESVASQLDKKAGIDNWLITKEHGLVFGLASRVQWPRNRSFDSFTVRVRSRYGGPTEIDKRRMEMVTPGAITPWWWCHAYIRCARGRPGGGHGDCLPDDHSFLAAGLIQTRHLVEAVDLDLGSLMPPNSDGTRGYQVRWPRLINEGYDVRIWREVA